MITGETEVTGQIKSSELRYLRVVLSQRLDGQHLQVFQDDPEIMKHFWSEYIYFLERKYPDLVRRFKAQFPSKRGMMADVQEPRLRDDYAHLALAWETLIDFLIDANVINQEEQSKWTAYADQYFAMLVRRQCVEAQKEDPYIRYIKEFWNLIQFILTAVGGWLGYFLGGCDGLLFALVVFAVVDYITGVMCAISDKKLSSQVGFKGICRKVIIFMLVGIAHMIDVNVIATGSILRTAVIFFYLSNEGVSLLENAAHLGLPIPEKLKVVLEQLHDRAEKDGE